MPPKKSAYPSPISASTQLLDYITTENVSEDAKDYKGIAIFRALFEDKFKKETEAQNADGYVEGKIVVELKSKYNDWLKGLFQALHYRKKGLTFNYVCVISYHFIGLWDIRKLPEEVLAIANGTEGIESASKAGQDNAKKISAPTKSELLDTSSHSIISENDFRETKKEKEAVGRDAKKAGLDSTRLNEFIQQLRYLDAGRIQINTSNFIQTIQLLQRFYDKPIDAVHAFYALIHYWDSSSLVMLPGVYSREPDTIQIYAKISGRSSEHIPLNSKYHKEFKKFFEDRFVFTNEGSGLTLDYYFSRFDEVLAVLDEDYVKQHGIFFTSDHLAKFALWFVKRYAEKELSDKYIVLDPAAGSGNLVTNWRLQLKHKIVSELQPDLLRIIERRMQCDPLHLSKGFTIVPKTSLGVGLNFLDKSAEDYLNILKEALQDNNQKLDKPLSFLLNPPYKSTDEGTDKREEVGAEYDIYPDILEITGNDAGKERYLAFLAQIQLLCREMAKTHKKWQPLLMIFTPTSWLIPRSTYTDFRESFDKEFEYLEGFIVKAGEFFKLDSGNWPVAFTIWRYKPVKVRENVIMVHDYTGWTSADLASLNWLAKEVSIDKSIETLLDNGTEQITLRQRGDIREAIPNSQTRYDFSRKKDAKSIGLVSGFPKTSELHLTLNRKCGELNGDFVGFMDDATPVRVKQDRLSRMSHEPDRVWFRLDNDVKSANRTRILNGATDKYGFCAFDIKSSQVLFTWFAITKSLNGHFPLWANQLDIWLPEMGRKAKKWHSLAYAIGILENRCVVTRFEADNPVEGAPEVFVDNPMAPFLGDNFYNTVLRPNMDGHPLAQELLIEMDKLYTLWNAEVTKGKQNVPAYCLEHESYFKYFDYEPFVTPHSGRIQIMKYAEEEGIGSVLEQWQVIKNLSAEIMETARNMLVKEFKYFS